MRYHKRRMLNTNRDGLSEIQFNASIHNRFDIEIIDADTGEIKQLAQAENIILNKLWSNIRTSYFGNIQYGTGTGTPSASRTGLFSFLGQLTASNAVYTMNRDTGVYSVRKQIVITETMHVGSILTEVGIGTTGGSLCTHAMIKDMNGNQISITKTSTDIINIYATVFVHYNPSGYAGLTLWSSLLLECISGVMTLSTLTTYILTGKGFGIDYQRASISATSAYDLANKKITITIPRLGASEQNIGGIAGFSFSDSILAVAGGSWFTGSAIVGEAIGTGDGSTKDFSLDFPEASNVTIYVDGVIENSVVVDNNPIGFSNYELVLDRIDSSGNKLMAKKLSRIYGGGIGGPNDFYFQNPRWETIGITELARYSSTNFVRALFSNDLTNWTEVLFNGSTTVAIPSELQHCRYLKFITSTGDGAWSMVWISKTTCLANNVHFTNAPASGAIITGDYTTAVIAKDSNHVFDLSVSITLGEKTT